MIQNQSILNVADNSGAKKLYVILCKGGSRRRYARIGDEVVCSVRHKFSSSTNVKEGQIVTAVVVRTKYSLKRKSGEKIKFNDNAAVIVNKDKTPFGTRIFGPVTRELRLKGYTKIISLAKEVL